MGDAGAIKRAYQAGLSMSGNGGLRDIPVFDMGSYNDTSGYHYQWYRFAIRERLRESNGDVGNHVMWRGSSVPFAKAWFLLNMWVSGLSRIKSTFRSIRRFSTTGPRRWSTVAGRATRSSLPSRRL